MTAAEAVASAAAVPPDSGAGEGEAERIAFWESQAGRLTWAAPWHTAHTFAKPQQIGTGDDGEPEFTVPEITWFAGGRLNASVNCLDRHVAAGRGDHPALLFEGEPGDRRTLTYAELTAEVCRAANALEALGVGPGDRVVVYLPVIPETIVIALACARIGAVHSLVFGGFSAAALRFRVEDTGAKVLVTSDGQFRRGTAVPVKDSADEACSGENVIEHVLVVRRTGDEIPWTDGRDLWWHEQLDAQPSTHEPEFFDAEHPLFIIYTSGTTGRPKGLVHTTGGYLTQAAYSHALLFGLTAGPEDIVNDQRAVDETVHWCTADLAWVTAHTYEIYGPLLNGVTEVIYEGTPQSPHPGRHFEIIERYGATTYYTAPTLVRSHMVHFPADTAEGERPADRWDLSSVRIVGTVGEAVNPEAWSWLHTQIGRSEVPFVDTWWQSETGSTILSPTPFTPGFKGGAVGKPLPGVSARVVEPDGADSPDDEQGLLVVDRPGPAIARTVWGDPQRYLSSYWQTFGERGWFFSGDGARRDPDGDIWVLGRIDDVINVSGHRLSTIEVESALLTHPWVAEAGTAPVADAMTGHAVLACVVLTATGRAQDPAAVEEALRTHIAHEIGPIAKPKHIVVVPDIPKTRSGKIMRRLLTQLHEGTQLGDTTSLQNAEAVGAIARIVGHPSAANRED